jgi:hypothetical protein
MTDHKVTDTFKNNTTNDYASGFQGLVKRWDKCLNVQGDYVEK